MNQFLRKRKTKNPCGGCGLNLELCICAKIPKIELKTKVTLVIHSREIKRTTNTGQLAIRSLINSDMHVRGKVGENFNLGDLIYDDYENLLLYPSDEAIELTVEFVQTLKKPIHLIVPDGNWRQASKVHYRNLHLKQLLRVKLKAPGKDQQYLRYESKEQGMATLQAIAYAIAAIEGDQVCEELLKVYNSKLANTLIGRGQK